MIYEGLSDKEKLEIRDKIEIEKYFFNLGYCFVTYVSTD